MAAMGDPPANLSLILLVLVLFSATISDQRTCRIPNSISIGGVVAGLGCAGAVGGLAGLADAGLGMLTGLGSLLPFYVLKAMGAGDVKLMAAVGSFLGPVATASAIIYTLLAGGVLAVLTIIRHDGVQESFKRYLFGLKHLFLSGTWLGERRSDVNARKLRFPYALAITVGTIAALISPLTFRL